MLPRIMNGEKGCSSPLPPYTNNRFSTMVAVWPHLEGGNVPVTGSSVHSSDTVQARRSKQTKLRPLITPYCVLASELKEAEKRITCVQNIYI